MLQSKPIAIRNAKGFREARGLSDELVVFRGFGSVVQTWRLEQRAESPTQGRGAGAGVEEGGGRERKGSGYAQNLYCVIEPKGNPGARDCPPGGGSRVALTHAICLRAQQPLW